LRSALGVSASVLLAPLVDGPRQELHVAHRGPRSCQLADAAGKVVACVIVPGSVRLPHAVVVPFLPREPSSVSVGDGSWGWDGFHASVSRWWAPSRPDERRLQARVDAQSAARFAAAWESGIGRGDGLTPFADDIVCGALVTLHAAGHPLAAAVAADIAAAPLERRTTATSAALLRLAALGYCIDELGDYLRARAVVAPDHHVRSEATQRLLGVGHTSGRGLLEGVESVLLERVEAVA
jgi:hypothetical protein